MGPQNGSEASIQFLFSFKWSHFRILHPDPQKNRQALHSKINSITAKNSKKPLFAVFASSNFRISSTTSKGRTPKKVPKFEWSNWHYPNVKTSLVLGHERPIIKSSSTTAQCSSSTVLLLFHIVFGWHSFWMIEQMLSWK